MLLIAIISGSVILLNKLLYPKSSLSKGYKQHVWQRFKNSIARYYLRYLFRKRVPRVGNHDPFSNDLTKFGFLASETERRLESTIQLHSDKETDGISFAGVGSEGEYLYCSIRRFFDGRKEVTVYVKLSDGSSYTLTDNLFNANDEADNDGGSCEWSAGGLKVMNQEPMRHWRIIFNGMMKKLDKVDNKDEDQIVHVKFRLTWTAMTEVFDFQEHLDQLAEGIAQNSIQSIVPSTERLFERFNCYEQGGFSVGTISINNEEDIEVRMRVIRSRNFGDADYDEKNKSDSAIIYSEDGDIYKIGVIGMEGIVSKLKYGYRFASNDFMHPLQENSLDFEDQLSNPENTDFTIGVVAGNKKFDMTVKRKEFLQQFYNGSELKENYCKRCTIHPSQFSVNGAKAAGFTLAVRYILAKPSDLPQKSIQPCSILYRLPCLKALTDDDKSKLVIDFDNEACCHSALVGGKGSSLAKLSILGSQSKAKEEDNFIVPRGCCLTVNAFRKHLLLNNHIQTAINDLELVTRQLINKNLQEETEKLMNEIKATQISTDLRQEIETSLRRVFGEEFEKTTRLAVRSSAVGEDSEEMSAAGQLTTFLGVRNLENIWQSILGCWASQFSFQAVEYNRQHGQLINQGMGVVLQEMVSADAAGVMFTQDHVSANPSMLTITSNFGLGESVVSASADPDTFILQRLSNDEIKVDQKQPGKKGVVINMDEHGGTIEKKLEDSEQFSITDEMAIKLGSIGVMVEKYFGDPRDLEWAVVGNTVYLLQARPITSFDLETDFELIHEHDSPIKSCHDVMSTANVGEVLPFAASPLAMSYVVYLMNCAIGRNFCIRESFNFNYTPYANNIITSFHRRIFINSIDCFYRMNEKTMSDRNKAFELAIFGRPLNEEKYHKYSVIRHGITSTKNSMMRLFYSIYDISRNKKLVEAAKDKYKNYKNEWEKCNSALELYQEIIQRSMDFVEVFVNHGQASLASIVYSLIILIASKRKDWDLDDYSDIAAILGSCNEVESAGVPILMQKLADTIARETNADEFSEKTAKDALDWLEEKNSQSNSQFEEFLKLHGHRCIAEFDVMSESWGMNPINLVKSLQIMVKTRADRQKNVKPSQSLDEMLDNLKKPLPNSTKRFFRWIVPKCRDAVGCREQTKSMVILVIDSMRQGFRRLGLLMVQEGFIPDKELVFFFTHTELEKVMKTRDPRIIAKATRRRRLHKQLNDLRFPEISDGYPQPIVEDEVFLEDSSCIINGTPVCHGAVKATARVVTDVANATEIQPGDILITRATDIGWSPYFPILGGVVTELGGLISHGAVVAREYGLPCIVGAKGATSAFKSGDKVMLNASKGILHKIE